MSGEPPPSTGSPSRSRRSSRSPGSAGTPPTTCRTCWAARLPRRDAVEGAGPRARRMDRATCCTTASRAWRSSRRIARPGRGAPAGRPRRRFGNLTRISRSVLAEPIFVGPRSAEPGGTGAPPTGVRGGASPLRRGVSLREVARRVGGRRDRAAGLRRAPASSPDPRARALCRGAPSSSRTSVALRAVAAHPAVRSRTSARACSRSRCAAGASTWTPGAPPSASRSKRLPSRAVAGSVQRALALPEACEALTPGSSSRGARCRSALECREGPSLPRAGADATGSVRRSRARRPPPASWGRTRSPSTFARTRGAIRSARAPACGGRAFAAVAIGEACTFTAQCGSGTHCGGGRCAPGRWASDGEAVWWVPASLAPAVGTGPAHAATARGERCRADQECVGACLRPDGGADGTCGMRCGTLGATSLSSRAGKQRPRLRAGHRVEMGIEGERPADQRGARLRPLPAPAGSLRRGTAAAAPASRERWRDRWTRGPRRAARRGAAPRRTRPRRRSRGAPGAPPRASGPPR